jgi:hypothetical protein
VAARAGQPEAHGAAAHGVAVAWIGGCSGALNRGRRRGRWAGN